MRLLASTLPLAMLLVGCAHTVGGTAEPATAALTILPSESEVTGAVGNSLSTFGFQPFVGGVEILPDGYRTEADASPIDCVAVTDTAPRIVYEPAAVAEAARQSYFNLNEGDASSGADAVVLRLSTPDAAERTFSTFARQWRQCDGVTVEKRLRGVTDAEVFATIEGVVVERSMLSATVRTRPGSDVAESRYERAVGVRGNTIVEVSLAIAPLAERASEPSGAVRVAEVMLDKAAA